MQISNGIKIDFDSLLVTLFCCYALSLPFELVLETLFNIETVFKPFRILAIIIIGVFGIKVLTQGLYLDKNNHADWFLYGVFFYGFIVSFFRIITGVFDMGLFLNDSFQFSLYVAIFFIYKANPITKSQALKIFRCFMIGIFLNAGYILYRFLTKIGQSRDAGFTDNPNYAAFGLVSVIIYVVLISGFKQLKYNIFLTGFLAFFFLYTFGIQGSRTGLIMIVIASVFVFFFSSIKRKIAILMSGVMIFVLLIPTQFQNQKSSSSIAVIERLNQKSEDQTEDVRFVIWRGVFRVLEIEGYAGMGIGQFKANFSKYYAHESNELILAMTNYGYFLSTHNDYLAILTDYGLPGLLLYVIFLLRTFTGLLFRLNDRNKNVKEEFLIQFCFIIFSCIVVFGLAAENFQHQLYWFLLMFTTKKY